MDGSTLPLPGLSPVSGKRIDARFDGGLLSSDGGILLLREVEQRLGVADRMAACINDPRAPDHITHSLAVRSRCSIVYDQILRCPPTVYRTLGRQTGGGGTKAEPA